MKKIIPLLAIFLVGCGARSADNQTNSSNSAASVPPGSPGNVNTPTVGVTNVLAITNGMGTNLATPSNQ